MIAIKNILKSNFFKHFGFYFLGAFFPMLIGFIKTPIFTRHYLPEDYGYLGLVMVAFGYFSTLSFSWLSSCMWRFYNKYKSQNRLNEFYFQLFFLFLVSTILLFAFTLGAYFYYSNPLVKQLVMLSFFNFSLKQGTELYLITVKLENNSKFYNVTTVLQSIFSFGILLWLAFGLNMNISALLLCSIIVDIFFVFFILIFRKTFLPSFNFKYKLNKSIIKEMFHYGGLSLLANLFFGFIMTSDRFIIAHYDSVADVGVYSKSYDLAQLSFMALVMVFFSTINPTMNRALEKSKGKTKLLVDFLNIITIVGLPFAFFLSIYSGMISEIFLGPKFRVGAIIMPFIFFATYLYPSLKIYENKLNFTQQVNKKAIVYGIALLVNLILNFIFIPKFGYIWAAISTLISYALSLLLFAWNDHFYLAKRLDYKTFFSSLLLLLLFLFIHFQIENYFPNRFRVSIIEASIYVILYILVFQKSLVKLFSKIQLD